MARKIMFAARLAKLPPLGVRHIITGLNRRGNAGNAWESLRLYDARRLRSSLVRCRYIRQRTLLHRKVIPGKVVGIQVAGHAAAAGPIDPHQVVEWLNQGTDPRRSPDNAGHTTTEGALILELESGKRIGLWPEGVDFLVAQDGNYYYLKQPELKTLLAKLDGR